MAVVGTQVLTYADLANRLGEDGNVARSIIELLSQTNEILQDMMVMAANSGIVHKTTVRTGLPTAAWRLLNYGIPRSKSTSASVTDTVGMLEAYSEVDARIVQLSKNQAALRLSEAQAFLEAMNQTMATTLFYGNTRTNPERFLGLAPRYSSLSAPNGANIVDAGGVGLDNTSIWLVLWGDNTIHGIYPDSSPAGIQHQDLGEVTLFDSNNNPYQGFRDHWMWDLGLTLRDWRYVVRIANIDVSNLSSDVNYLKSIIGFMIDAEERVFNMSGGRAVWYGNRTIRSALRKATLEKIANNLTAEEVAGNIVTRFDAIPFRMTDAILNNEARVV
jgi:hypothetical protein